MIPKSLHLRWADRSPRSLGSHEHEKCTGRQEPGTLANKKSHVQKFPRHFQIKMRGKRGPLHHISGWMVSLRAVCVPKLRPRIVPVCVLLELGAQVIWLHKELIGHMPQQSA